MTLNNFHFQYHGKLILMLTLLVVSLNTWSHPLAPSLLQLQETNAGITVIWKTNRKTNGTPMSPELPSICQQISEPKIDVQETSVITKLTINCGKPSLVGEIVSAKNLEKNITTVLVRYIHSNGQTVSQLLSQKEPYYKIPATMTKTEILQDYGLLGVDHLVFGFDHVLFVIALALLIRSFKTLLIVVTCFTLGHSITLAASYFQWIPVLNSAVFQQWVEIAIAGSIIVLALELLNQTDSPSLTEKSPWLLPTAFGLLHGMGFASALAETGLPNHEIPFALFAFNVGIEVGQLTIIAGLLLARQFCAAFASSIPTLHQPKGARVLIAYGLGSISAFWVISRTLG